jgi:hypothetical protein
VAAGLCSGIAWSGRSSWLLPLSLVLPLLLGLAETRRAAIFIAAIYFAVALAPCIRAAQVFFEHRSPLGAFLLWLAWVSALTTVFALGWRREKAWRAAAMTTAVIAAAILPIGLGSPLTSAGLLFPGTAFAGVLFTVVLCFALSARAWKLFGITALAAVLWQARYSPPQPLQTWRAVATSFGGKAYGPMDPAASFRALMWVSARARSSPAQVLLFPENVLPDYSDAVTGEWIDLGTVARQGTTIVIGSDRPTVSFERRENVLLARGALSAEYVQRVPIPVAMWGRDTDAHLFGPGVMKIGDRRAAVLLCYEQLLVAPVLQSFLNRPDVLLAASNLYWARGTNVDAVEQGCVEAWARLFGVPYLRAVNR